ncbi:MAG: HAMP domain-containing histidine kinase [Erysipelothrix sp.]|nr:HAMP domain-containing histidine kinase [Erysipelothrix sp.]
MKRKHSLFSDLSLTQQLVGIILIFVTVFLSFFFVYLNKNINNFVRVEMEGVLGNAQEGVVENYKREDTGMFLESNNDFNISHKIWTKEAQYQTQSFRYLSSDVRNQINLITQQLLTQKKDFAFFEVSDADQQYLIAILNDADQEITVVSTLSNAYRQEFKSRLISNILNAIFAIVFILFAIMLIWVTSIIHSLGKIQDYIDKVSGGKQAELNLSRQDEIGQVGEALVSMNKEILRQEGVKEELIQNISHDLKTPIATIKSYGESIKDGIYPYDTLEKSVDVIIEHANRLEQKVYSLLLLNRMEYLVSTSEDKTIDLKAVLEKTLLSVRVVRPEINIITQLESSIFKGEEESWRVVCENILDNAFRYAKTYIKITLTQDYLSFENDGIPLTSEVIETMFKAYEKGSDGGFGMGLSIVHRVVEAYGYDVYAENTQDGVIVKINKTT